MLIQILDYIRRQKIATNQQLAREFNIDSSALQPMLDVWVKKGMIAFCQENSTCFKGCATNCRKESPIYLKFIG